MISPEMPKPPTPPTSRTGQPPFPPFPPFPPGIDPRRFPGFKPGVDRGKLPPFPENLPKPSWLKLDKNGAPMGDPADMPLAAMAGDTITPLLQNLRISSWSSGVSVMCGAWGVTFPIFMGGYFAVFEGSMFVSPAQGEPVQLFAGDFAVAKPMPGLKISNLPATPGRPIHEVFRIADAHKSEGMKLGEGPLSARFTGGPIIADRGVGGPLRSALPDIVVVRGSTEPADGLTRSVLRLLERQIGDRSPGGYAIINQLVSLLFIQCVQGYFKSDEARGKNWTSAVLDEHLGPLLALLHAMPGRDWSMKEMADEAGLSRTIFHERFVAMTGVPPATYLREHRMSMASELLKGSGADIRAIARRVGYGSEGAFCSAFRRWAGCTPGEYRAKHADHAAASARKPGADAAPPRRPGRTDTP